MFVFRNSMMARLVAVAAVALVTSGAQFSCSSGDPSLPPARDIDSGDGPDFLTTLTLRDSSGAEIRRFRRGELITFELVVRNRRAETVTVDVSSTQATDFLVFRHGADTPLWTASQGLMFPAVITPLTFAPNETKVLSITWNQEIPDGSFLAQGNYEARGAVMAVGVLPTPLAGHQLASGLEAFSIH